MLVAQKFYFLLNQREWFVKRNEPYPGIYAEKVRRICQEYLPHGSGLDGIVELDLQRSSRDKLVFVVDVHHMDSNGCYTGWTTHSIIVEPSFWHFNIRVTGRNKNSIKEHLASIFSEALMNEYKEEAVAVA